MLNASAQRPELVQMLSRLLAADVLLAGREGQHEAALAVGVDRLAAEPPGHLSHELLAAAEQAEVGSAEIESDAERLAFADDDVGAKIAGRLDQAERDRLGDHRDQQRALGVRRLGDVARSGMRPRMSGYWTTTQEVSASMRRSSLRRPARATSSGPRVKPVAGELRHRPRDLDVMRVKRPRRPPSCRAG